MSPSPLPRLPDSEVKAFLKSNPRWKLEEAELRRTFKFESFAESLSFVAKVGELAEKEKHHPDIDIRFKRVVIALVTYDADGITRRDVDLAEKIAQLVKK